MAQTGSQSSGWQLGSDAPLAYDTYIVDAFMQDYSRRLVEAAAIESGYRVLDIACGTGVAADEALLPVGLRAVRVMRFQGGAVVAALVTEYLPEGSVPRPLIPQHPT